MNYKEKFKKVLNHEKGNYFLVDYGGDQASISIFVYNEVLKKLGINRTPRINSLVQLSALPEDEFLRRYNIGLRWLYPKSSRKTLELKEIYKRAFNIETEKEILKGYVHGGTGDFFYDEWGVKWKRSAYYFEMVEHPLQGKSFEEIKKYCLPDPTDKLRVDGLKEELKKYYNENPNYVISLCQSYGGLLETALWIRGFTDFYIDIASNPQLTNYLLDSIEEYFLEWNKNYLTSVDGKVDIVAMGDDYGMQDRTLLSPEIWRNYVKNRYRNIIENTKSYYPDIKWFHHSCGSIVPIISDLVEIGVDILNPIQPTAKDMNPEDLKKKFGAKLTFHGGIDIQHLLMKGEPSEIKEEVKKVVKILSENGGYIAAPSHNIQANTPVDNIMAVYETLNEIEND
ncbi:MAG: hypothetical protein M1371_07245 [Actinobacteria bacterium]|nr:hypothetical protein [Actinomycetota bacterium]